MDIFLIVVTAIFGIILFIVSFYVLALYCHPDDKGFGTHILLKILVVLGLSLSWAQVLMVPLDVANQRGFGGGLDMQSFWIIIYIIIAIMIAIQLPFAIFLYEADEDKSIFSRIFSALILTILTLAFSCLVLFLSWNYLQYAEIPVQTYSSNSNNFQMSNTPLSSNINQNITSSQQILEITVTFVVYLMALMSFIGWFLFSLFAGIGIVALPLDLILQFKHKPKRISSKQAANKKLQLKTEIQNLIEQGVKIQADQQEISIAQGGFWKMRKLKNDSQINSDKFISSVLALEQDVTIFKQELNYANLNPLVFWGKLILGIFLAIISLIIWLHIIIYEATLINKQISTNPFLNTMLIGLDNSGAGFISSSIFSGILIYLLICTVKGNFKCGLRIPFLFTFHPMIENETFMNSFLFNVLLILICSVSLTQFSVQIFSDYCRFTSIQMFFGNQVSNLKFFKYFYQNNVFGYAFVCISVLSLFFLLCCSNNKPKQLKEYQDSLKKKKNKK